MKIWKELKYTTVNQRLRVRVLSVENYLVINLGICIYIMGNFYNKL